MIRYWTPFSMRFKIWWWRLKKMPRRFLGHSYNEVVLFLTTLKGIPINNDGAANLGRLHARLCMNVRYNPYARESNYSSSYTPGLYFLQKPVVDYWEEMAKAYYLGFGEVAWKKMVKGYPYYENKPKS